MKAPSGLHPLTRDLGAASKSQFAAETLNLAAKLGVIGIPVYFAVRHFVCYQSSPAQLKFDFWIFFACLAYEKGIYPVWLKDRFLSRKWKQAALARIDTEMVAVSQICVAMERGRIGEVEKNSVYQGILAAILSELEALVVDSEGIYLNATLLIPDPVRHGCLRVAGRARLTRPLHVSYPAREMVAGRAIENDRTIYEPDFQPGGNRRYRCVLVIPILFEDGRRQIRSLGAISLDSERPHHFDGLVERIEQRLTSYRNLFKILLVWEDRCRSAAPLSY